jgi:hypothetical protein
MSVYKALLLNHVRSVRVPVGSFPASWLPHVFPVTAASGAAVEIVNGDPGSQAPDECFVLAVVGGER